MIKRVSNGRQCLVRMVACGLAVLPLPGFTQQGILESYIRDGLQNNLSLQQKVLNYNKSLAALRQAKAFFYPTIGFHARYSVAEGGRTIDFPVGDLLNPVYSTLNQLTHSQQFSQVSNEQIYFLRPTEQETMLVLEQPLFRSDIWFQYKIRKEMTHAAFIGIDIYSRELVKEIKTAYYNFLKSARALELFDQTLEVVQENLRVSESLFSHDKVTADAVYRSRAELSKVEQQRSEARRFLESARSYVNFLLNKSPESEVETDIHIILIDSLLCTPIECVGTALANREELNQITSYINAAGSNLRMNQFSRTPTLGLGVNYGIQGETYEFTGDSDFIIASLVLEWKLFHGLETRSRIQQAAIEQQLLEKQFDELKNQISMQVIDAWYGVKASATAVTAARTQSNSAVKAFEIVRKKYNQGQSSLLEFINVRTDMTNAELNLILASYDYEISKAELERAMGTYPFEEGR